MTRAEVENSGEIFLALLGRGEEAIDLPLAWAALTEAVKGPADTAKALRALDELKREAFSAVGAAGERPDLRLARLNSFFSKSAAFRGNTDDYADPANSYIDDVLARRTGIPITLSLIFIELGAACGIAIDPIAFPGHFLVRERSTGTLCDPFTAQVGLGREDCMKMLAQISGRQVAWDDEYLMVPGKIVILQRMLNNLKNSFVASADMKRLEIVEHLIGQIDLAGAKPESVLLH